MASKLFSRRKAKTALLCLMAVVLALIVGQCSLGSASAAAPAISASAQTTVVSPPVLVGKRPLGPLGRPQVKVAVGDRPVKVLIRQLGVEYTGGDLVDQAARTTEVYRLTKLPSGQTARWRVVVFDAKTGDRLVRKTFQWTHWKHRVKPVRGASIVDVYLQVAPAKSGTLRVRNAKVLTLTRAGEVRQRKMVWAYTDERYGTRVYVYTMRRGERPFAVLASLAGGRLGEVTTQSGLRPR